MKVSMKALMAGILIQMLFTGCFFFERDGCTDPVAKNYDPSADNDDNSCIYKKKGCTDSKAVNYNASAEEENGNCEYISGTYSVSDDCGSNYNMTITENGDNLKINNVGNAFDNISAVRSGTTIELLEKIGALSHAGVTFDFRGGTGSYDIINDKLIFHYSYDDYAYGSFYGLKSCSAEGTK
jgi:hypothetical protein